MFASRIAVVTGGNKGIGLEICRQLASNGIKVVLTARDETRGTQAVEKLRNESGLSDVVFHQLDVTDASSIASLAEFIRTHFGKLDILVRDHLSVSPPSNMIRITVFDHSNVYLYLKNHSDLNHLSEL